MFLLMAEALGRGDAARLPWGQPFIAPEWGAAASADGDPQHRAGVVLGEQRLPV